MPRKEPRLPTRIAVSHKTLAKMDFVKRALGANDYEEMLLKLWTALTDKGGERLLLVYRDEVIAAGKRELLEGGRIDDQLYPFGALMTPSPSSR